jgi:WhiB family transcriptional regulator, redox-sensing transcriptional regulator
MTTLRQLLGIEKKYLELHEAIRKVGSVECEELPDVFFTQEASREGQQLAEEIAKNMCESCPVRVQCRDYALSTRVYGIWGGTTFEERYSSLGT